MSSAVTFTLGRAYWGIGSLRSVTPEVLVLALTPLVMLAYLRYEKQWRIVLVFAFIGLTGNLHLVTAMNFTAVLLIVYLSRQGLSPRAIGRAACCGAAALAGALPYAWYYYALRSSMTPRASTPARRWSTRPSNSSATWSRSSTRDCWNRCWSWLLVIAVPLTLVIAAMLPLARFRLRFKSLWLWMVAAAIFVAMGLQGISQLWGHLSGKGPPVVDFYRAASLAMLPLYVLFAQALTNLFRLVRTHRFWLATACAAMLAAWIIPSDNFQVARHSLLDTATMFMNEVDKPAYVQRHHERSGERAELDTIARWAAAHTDASAVFFTTDIRFRMLSRRSIVASDEDIGYFYYVAEPAGRLGPPDAAAGGPASHAQAGKGERRCAGKVRGRIVPPA